ncbi:NADH dehydrogenase subunit D [Desulfotomaculum arcticum]|uniref:NADH-quinone oxidoreductase subunit D n=1 Tax=Desulfotruncus arcticus DSM 17038 TaxID=1121424 RepID=A0A1I2RI65_9FIRM|nr:NADH-quinone oxidoreductase subunit D [Desulfotruncus arcticus]SFG40355.1 NADH dehydrogenase subunit D [Desulfotomaculum arcticum] [Desulfotruncus arcticus DSM 17038]
MLRTQEYLLNFGPQHPSTHGVFQIILTLDGERIVKGEPVCGYLHRGIEKLAEARTYTQVIPYTDRMDYLAAMLQNWGYVQAVEKLMDIEVPERAEYLRVISGELSRLTSHLIGIGINALDIGAFTGFLLCFREREKLMDLLEELTGSRMTLSYARIGGVADDAPEGWLDKLKKLMDEMPGYIEEYQGLITGNEIFQARTKFIGKLTPETAINYSLSGPTLRGSGVNYDLRKAKPYSIYDRFDFEVPLGENGDCFDRFVCRMLEMEQSVRIIQQAIEQIKEVDGPVIGKVPKVLKPPKGEAYHEIESSKGIIGYYVVSDGSNKPYRVHVRRPSFINLGYLDEMVRGYLLADVVAILSSIDIVLGEVDC